VEPVEWEEPEDLVVPRVLRELREQAVLLELAVPQLQYHTVVGW
jgi:hypothetical protein